MRLFDQGGVLFDRVHVSFDHDRHLPLHGTSATSTSVSGTDTGPNASASGVESITDAVMVDATMGASN